MARNKLTDLNDHLFGMLEMLEDDKAMQDPKEADKLIKRAGAMCKVSTQILQVASLQVRAIKTAEECGLLNEDMPALLATKDSKTEKAATKKLLEATGCR